MEAGSKQGFDQVAGRYLNLVYSTCLREIGDAHLAEDATQVVFLRLPRKARVLPRATVLSGGLFHTTHLVARNIRRGGGDGAWNRRRPSLTCTPPWPRSGRPSGTSYSCASSRAGRHPVR